MPQITADPKQKLLDDALAHVPFDGWSAATFDAAIRDSGVDPTVARAVCPRGAVDLAVAYHQRGDDQMRTQMAAEEMQALKIREKIAAAVRTRLQVVDKEAVRKGAALFALPQYAADGARLIWGTSDAIWRALGDTSDDINWYTKRATLSGVYSATVLFWMGDTSDDHDLTWAFLDRRIEDVMRIEKVKAKVRKSPLLSRLAAGPEWMFSHIKPPSTASRDDFPGHWGRQ